MRATSRGVLFGTLVLIGAAGAAAQTTPTVDEIIEKAIAAEGGRATLAKVKSQSAAGTISLPTPGGDISGTIEVLNEAPNKVRSLVQIDLSAMGGGTLVADERFDGTSGYAMDTMQGNNPITGSRLDALRNTIFPSQFLDYKERGMKIALTGREKVGDRDAFALVMTPATGPQMRFWIDAATYLTVKSSVTVDVPQLGNVEQTFELSDFRDINGVKVPHAMRGSTGPQSFTVVFTKVQHNVKIDPSMFVKPADK